MLQRTTQTAHSTTQLPSKNHPQHHTFSKTPIKKPSKTAENHSSTSP
jgi:hypothetical protein